MIAGERAVVVSHEGSSRCPAGCLVQGKWVDDVIRST